MNNARGQSPNESSDSEYHYWAFISYSQKDRRWAEWLHRRLERYRLPKLAAPAARPPQMGTLPARLFPVFRDRDELPGAADLGAQLTEALARSRNLVVVCSPSAARSTWVEEEIKAFKALGRADRVFALIVDGEPNATDNPRATALECFPRALRYRVTAGRELTEERVEPLGADIRPDKDGKQAALLKLIAGILGLGYDQFLTCEEWQNEVADDTYPYRRLCPALAAPRCKPAPP